MSVIIILILISPKQLYNIGIEVHLSKDYADKISDQVEQCCATLVLGKEY